MSITVISKNELEVKSTVENTERINKEQILKDIGFFDEQIKKYTDQKNELVQKLAIFDEPEVKEQIDQLPDENTPDDSHSEESENPTP